MVTVDMITRDNTNYADNLGTRGSTRAALSARDEFVGTAYVTRTLMNSLAKEYEAEGRRDHAGLIRAFSGSGFLRSLNGDPSSELMAVHMFFRHESGSGKWEYEAVRDVTMLLAERPARAAIILLSSGDAKLNAKGRVLSRDIESVNENVNTWFDMAKGKVNAPIDIRRPAVGGRERPSQGST